MKILYFNPISAVQYQTKNILHSINYFHKKIQPPHQKTNKTKTITSSICMWTLAIPHLKCILSFMTSCTHTNICLLCSLSPFPVRQICAYKHPLVFFSILVFFPLFSQPNCSSLLPASQSRWPPALQPIRRSGTKRRMAGQLICSRLPSSALLETFGMSANFRELNGLEARVFRGSRGEKKKRKKACSHLWAGESCYLITLLQLSCLQKRPILALYGWNKELWVNRACFSGSGPEAKSTQLKETLFLDPLHMMLPLHMNECSCCEHHFCHFIIRWTYEHL